MVEFTSINYEIELCFLYWHHQDSRKAFLFTNDRFKSKDGFSTAHMHTAKGTKEVGYKISESTLQIMDVKYRIKNLDKSKHPYYLTLITEKGKELLFTGLAAPEW